MPESSGFDGSEGNQLECADLADLADLAIATQKTVCYGLIMSEWILVTSIREDGTRTENFYLGGEQRERTSARNLPVGLCSICVCILTSHATGTLFLSLVFLHSPHYRRIGWFSGLPLLSSQALELPDEVIHVVQGLSRCSKQDLVSSVLI